MSESIESTQASSNTNIFQDAQGGSNDDLSLTQQHNLFHGVLASKRPPRAHTYTTVTQHMLKQSLVVTGWDKANLRPTR